MNERVDVESGLTLPAWFVAELVGVSEPAEIEFGRSVIAALEAVDPSLAPSIKIRGLAPVLARGVAGLGTLIDCFEGLSIDEDKVEILDAMTFVVRASGSTPELERFLERVLAEALTARVGSAAARALATTGHPAFLEHQRRLLGSKRPSELAAAARLLGHGRYAPAVPMLLDALRPENAMAADAIIWALGEIGEMGAVAKLHTILAQHGKTERVLEALGQIGSRISVGRLFPFLLEGEPGQRLRAAEALVRIARKNDGSFGDPALDASVRATLEKVIEADGSRAVRFFAMVAHACLGGRLAPAEIIGALRLSAARTVCS